MMEGDLLSANVSVDQIKRLIREPPRTSTQAQGETPRMSWARLLKRVFDIDVKHCPDCGGALKIIAAIEDPPVIAKILSHLGLPTRAPPARACAVESIYSRQSEEPKTACQRKPTAAARSEFERAAP